MLFLNMAIFAFVTCASPGPINILASISGAQNKLKANLPFILGATSGLSLVIIVTGLGIGQLPKTHTLWTNALTLLGSIYILYLAFSLAKANLEIDTSERDVSPPSLFTGVFLQIINPKAWLVSMSGVAMYLSTGNYTTLFIAYVGIFFVICFIAILFWVYIGTLVAQKLKRQYLTIFSRSMASLLAMLVLYNLYVTFSSYL